MCPGGWIHTLQSDGFLFEQGPRSCRTRGGGQETLSLVELLGLEEQVILPHPSARDRFVYQEKNQEPMLLRLPGKLWKIPFHPLTPNCLKVLWRDWKMPKRIGGDESVFSFFERRLGREWTENLIDPLISGIYAGDGSHLSIQSCFPVFDQWEQQHGSLVRGAMQRNSSRQQLSPFVKKMQRYPLFSFREGMATLPNALAAELKDSLHLGAEVVRLDIDSKQAVIWLKTGQRIDVDQVISTLPAYALSAIWPQNSSFSEMLSSINYASVVILNIGFDRKVLHQQGFGYLISSMFGLKALGCVWDSCVFPQQSGENQTRLALMLGGSRHPDVEFLSEAELIEAAGRILKTHMKIDIEPQTIQIFRANRAIPQFEVGFAQKKREMERIRSSLFPRLTMGGSAWSGVSINDCVAYSKLIGTQRSQRSQSVALVQRHT